MEINPKYIIRQKTINDVSRIGIVMGKEWYKDSALAFIYADFFVVAKWSDFHDGIKSHCEGLETISACQYKEDAELIFNMRRIMLKK
jgi:hypothetical protein